MNAVKQTAITVFNWSKTVILCRNIKRIYKLNKLSTDQMCRLLFWKFSFDIFSKKLFFNLSNSQIYILDNKKMPHAFTVHVSVQRIQIQSL